MADAKYFSTTKKGEALRLLGRLCAAPPEPFATAGRRLTQRPCASSR
jgi:hypothetical protein